MSARMSAALSCLSAWLAGGDCAVSWTGSAASHTIKRGFEPAGIWTVGTSAVQTDL